MVNFLLYQCPKNDFFLAIETHELDTKEYVQNLLQSLSSEENLQVFEISYKTIADKLANQHKRLTGHEIVISEVDVSDSNEINEYKRKTLETLEKVKNKSSIFTEFLHLFQGLDAWISELEEELKSYLGGGCGEWRRLGQYIWGIMFSHFVK